MTQIKYHFTLEQKILHPFVSAFEDASTLMSDVPHKKGNKRRLLWVRDKFRSWQANRHTQNGKTNNLFPELPFDGRLFLCNGILGAPRACAHNKCTSMIVVWRLIDFIF